MESKRVELHIPFITFLKVFTAVVSAYAIYLLWPFPMLLFLAILVAVTLHPAVHFLTNHRVPKWLAILLISTALVGTLIGGALLIFPPLVEQIQEMSTQLPEFKEKALTQLPETAGIRDLVKKTFEKPPKAEKYMDHLLVFGQSASEALMGFGLLLILAIYFLVDGERTYKWCLAFFSAPRQKKLRQTCEEISHIIFAYVMGQIITSVLAGIFTFIILLVLKVPGALLLALLAGVFDILPVVGFFISIVPAILLALTVSPTTALLVIAAYVAYNAAENYLIVPKIYGHRLDVSGLIVLLTLIIAGSLGGVMGAIVILPVVASYPIIERIWLQKLVGREAVKDHRQV